MTYEITLLEADIKGPLLGSMTLALSHKAETLARLSYRWDNEMFSAVFHGHAPDLPYPAHPTVLLQRPIAALYAQRTKEHALITDVFRDHEILINTDK